MDLKPFREALEDARGIIDAAWSYPPSPQAGRAIPKDFTIWANEIVDAVCEAAEYPLDAAERWKAVEYVDAKLVQLEESGFDESDDDDFWSGF